MGMNTGRLLGTILILIGGCSPIPDKLILGGTYDLDHGEFKTINVGFQYNLPFNTTVQP